MTAGRTANSFEPRKAVEHGPRQRPIIAIDGPAGAGKSTLAAHLARTFGFLNLETGAMYRALALKAIERDFGFEDEASLVELASSTRIRLESEREANRVFLDGVEVSRRIRDTDVTSAASQISVHPRLRAWMVAEQRALGQTGGVVMEGRDIGTAVFPDAEVKIFLDAAPEVRGNRRYQQLPASSASADSGDGVRAQPPVTETALLNEMRERDARDRNRAESPLRPAADAILIDSTNLTLDQVMAEAERIVRHYLSISAAGSTAISAAGKIDKTASKAVQSEQS
jgi:cytidylate kinase